MFPHILKKLIQASALLTGFSVGAEAAVETFFSKTLDDSNVTGSSYYLCSETSFEMEAAGGDLNGAVDGGQFVFRIFEGDVDITARVESASSAPVGLMIRETLDEGSPMSMVSIEGSQVEYLHRDFVGGSVTAGDFSSTTSWVRMQRSGSSVSVYLSDDGQVWDLFEYDTVDLGNSIQVGMFVSDGTASFSDVSLSGVVLEVTCEATDGLVVKECPVTVEEYSMDDIGKFYGDIVGESTYDSDLGVLVSSVLGGSIWGGADDFHYVYREINQDVQVTVRVDSLVADEDRGRAGLMLRDSLEGDSIHAFVSVSKAKGLALERRNKEGSGTRRSAKGGIEAPIWLRLVKETNIVSAYYSIDGKNWDLLSEDRVDFSGSTYIGLATVAEDPSAFTEATFSNYGVVELDVDDNADTYLSADIGYVGEMGVSVYDDASDSFLIEASGSDIGGYRDSFHYVYRQASGDFEVMTKVASLDATQAWSKAGLMVRENLAANSEYYANLLTRDFGTALMCRLDAGVESCLSSVGQAEAPSWVKLVRRGNLFTSYASSNGVDWVFLGEKEMEFSDSVFVGLAVTSRDNDALALVQFDQMQVIN